MLGDTPQCLQNAVYSQVMVPLMCALPLWFRLQQNVRRFYDTGEHWPNLGNALKYALSQVVVIFGSFHGMPFAPANLIHFPLNRLSSSRNWFPIVVKKRIN